MIFFWLPCALRFLVCSLLRLAVLLLRRSRWLHLPKTARYTTPSQSYTPASGQKRMKIERQFDSKKTHPSNFIYGFFSTSTNNFFNNIPNFDNKKMLKTLRHLAIWEGVSYLLLAITMLLKYVWKIPEPNYAVGVVHGGLFILYCVFVMLCSLKFNWTLGKTLILGIASLVPFGTFWAEKKYLRN